MMSFLQRISRTRKAPSSVLGLAFDGRRVEGTLMRRTPDGLRPSGAFEAELSADFDGADSEALGRELRSRLDEAGLRERLCAVVVPVGSLWVTQTEIPAMAEADALDLLQLEAEKGFHADASGLQLAISRCTRPDGTQWATLAVLPPARLASLERLLTAARLKPVSIGADLVELHPPAAAPASGVITLRLGGDPGSVSLQATAGGALVALRSFEVDAEDGPGAAAPRSEAVAREVRITLGQLPEPWSQTLRRSGSTVRRPPRDPWSMACRPGWPSRDSVSDGPMTGRAPSPRRASLPGFPHRPTGRFRPRSPPGCSPVQGRRPSSSCRPSPRSSSSSSPATRRAGDARPGLLAEAWPVRPPWPSVCSKSS